MNEALRKLRAFAEWLDADDDPEVPAYDPVHLGGMLVVNLVVIGVVYWLLWTLLVYEGGLPGKLTALARLALGRPNGPDAFEGWFGNFAALVLCGVTAGALHRQYAEAARRPASQ